MSLYLIKVLYKNDLYKYTVNKGLQVTFINLNLLYKEEESYKAVKIYSKRYTAGNIRVLFDKGALGFCIET